jgi:SAM-dependent methyltransferase
MKVQFGSGSNQIEGWTNHDAEVDITKRLPYEDNSVEMILMEHCWEHIGPHDALRCLDECRRILQPGGVLRLLVPVIDDPEMTVEHARDLVFGHGHLATYTTDLVYHLLSIAGFKHIDVTGRKTEDGHWRVIGVEKDTLETLRIEGTK